ncbi:hypothetical protein SERLADRAFT_404808 [Serpula lacrymans var. lacrymans S7.9]|uniref:Uncharacterized protein n=1 Tax=Serpula lacrymans var. lacrymans (strain S7.9) TaxID=578457 RepID=F8NF81_SERL9|nr:uncharacterized protein SERLADRAFT_404808 [Serpula lacrymans var. lacrymans S7.9]EGO30795.1 hypothetical protein SERLADRAFT_404808 [Serpula lacrymans var. lacrymans S7.9]
MAMVTSVSGQVSVKVLHQDGSISNSLIVDQALSDWPFLKAPEGCAPPNTHIRRGLLADWGFVAVFEDTEELAEHSDDSKKRTDNVSEDSDQNDHYFGFKSGGVQKLQELVKSMLSTFNHEEEIIRSDQKGTLDEVIQQLSKEGWQVGNGNHVLECTPYEMKDADAKEKDNIKEWLNPDFTSMFTRSDAAFHKYQTFGRVDGLSLFLENNRFVEAGPPPFFVLLHASHDNVFDILGEALEEIQCNEKWKQIIRHSLFLILQPNKMLVNRNTPHPCPASCGRAFTSTRALNTHLGSARSCAWYCKGKLREVLTQQDGNLERQGLLVEENLDNPYGPPHPFQEESIGDTVEDIEEDLFAFILLKQPE